MSPRTSFTNPICRSFQSSTIHHYTAANNKQSVLLDPVSESFNYQLEFEVFI